MRKEQEATAAAAASQANDSSFESSVREDKLLSNFLDTSEGDLAKAYTPSMEYYTTASSGSRTPAPSYREFMPDLAPKMKTSSSSLGPAYGRAPLGRSRSGTIASLAFSNNSLPYLPYTPMLELPGNFALIPERMPSPVPVAVVPSSPPMGADSDLESHADKMSAPSSLELSSSAEQGAVRTRRIRLARSTSNLCLPTFSLSGSKDELSELRSTSPLGIYDIAARPRSRSKSSTTSIASLPMELEQTHYIPPAQPMGGVSDQAVAEQPEGGRSKKEDSR